MEIFDWGNKLERQTFENWFYGYKDKLRRIDSPKIDHNESANKFFAGLTEEERKTWTAGS